MDNPTHDEAVGAVLAQVEDFDPTVRAEILTAALAVERPAPRYAVQMYRARSDVYGNPRGWWIMRELLHDDGGAPWHLGDVVDAEERGYQWSNRMPDRMRRADVLDLGTVDVDADGLRQAKALAANVWAPFAVVDQDRVWRWCWSRSAARRERDDLARAFSPRVFTVEERYAPRRTVAD